MKEDLAKQYAASLGMLRDCIEQFEDNIWYESEGHSNPAWQIAYHIIFFANIYCAPTGEAIVHWLREIEGYEVLGKCPWPPHEKLIPESTFTREEMLEFLDHVAGQVPGYLETFEADKPCWAPWYKLTQFGFQINSIRHIQHHAGQLLERQSAHKAIDLRWQAME